MIVFTQQNMQNDELSNTDQSMQKQIAQLTEVTEQVRILNRTYFWMLTYLMISI